MGISNPLPLSLEAECSKCTKILASFVDPSKAFGPDKFIPPQVLANAKGLAILSVFKAGFLGSARYGNGIVVARLPDGTWSAPSAIGTGGAGFGGQIGFELTDFVFILNDRAAVQTFYQAGTITLGGNVSVAAGPSGRNAEAAGAATLKGFSGIFSYSKTRGLFAGVSLEGSAIVERRDANEKLYGHRVTATQLLTGSIPIPPAAISLINILNSRFFAGVESKEPRESRKSSQENSSFGYDNQEYHHTPRNKTKSNFRENLRKHCSTLSSSGHSGIASNTRHARDAEPYPSFSPSNDTSIPGNFESAADEFSNNYVYSDNPQTSKSSEKNSITKPFCLNTRLQSLSQNQALALFSYKAEQPGDLSFRKGDIIVVTKSSDFEDDWWTGTIGNQTGNFPANYVKMRQ